MGTTDVASDLDLSKVALTVRCLACRIVGTSGFYPGRKVDVPCTERFTLVMAQRLAAPGARLAAVLNAIWRYSVLVQRSRT